MKLHDQPHSIQQVKHAPHKVQRQDSNLPPVQLAGDHVVSMVKHYEEALVHKTKGVRVTLPMRKKQRPEVEFTWNDRYLVAMSKAYAVWEKAKSGLKFLDWVDTKKGRIPVGDQEVDLGGEPGLEFFDDNERPTLRVQFDENNRALDSTQTPLPEGKHMFIVGVDNHVYVAQEEPKRINHASFCKGGETFGAGELTVDSGGQVTEVSNKSGHYRPQPIHSVSALFALSQKGLDVGSVKFTAYRKKGTQGDLRGRLVRVSQDKGIKSPRSFEPESPSLKTQINSLHKNFASMLISKEQTRDDGLLQGEALSSEPPPI